MKQVLFTVLMIAAVGMALFSFFASAGIDVLFLGFACFLGIVCRIIQAEIHYQGEKLGE